MGRGGEGHQEGPQKCRRREMWCEGAGKAWPVWEGSQRVSGRGLEGGAGPVAGSSAEEGMSPQARVGKADWEGL